MMDDRDGRDHSDQKHGERQQTRGVERINRRGRQREKWAGRAAQLQSRRFRHRKVSTQRAHRCGRYADRSGPCWRTHTHTLALPSDSCTLAIYISPAHLAEACLPSPAAQGPAGLQTADRVRSTRGAVIRCCPSSQSTGADGTPQLSCLDSDE